MNRQKSKGGRSMVQGLKKRQVCSIAREFHKVASLFRRHAADHVKNKKWGERTQANGEPVFETRTSDITPITKPAGFCLLKSLKAASKADLVN